MEELVSRFDLVLQHLLLQGDILEGLKFLHQIHYYSKLLSRVDLISVLFRFRHSLSSEFFLWNRLTRLWMHFSLGQKGIDFSLEVSLTDIEVGGYFLPQLEKDLLESHCDLSHVRVLSIEQNAVLKHQFHVLAKVIEVVVDIRLQPPLDVIEADGLLDDLEVVGNS